MPATPGDFPAPDLSDERVLRYEAGLRPYRQGAIRLEAELLDGLRIVHNYGHGGAGITLAPGCARQVVHLVRGFRTTGRVAVLGAGVNGLSVALALAGSGYEVDLYAREFPPHTTSNVAGGQWAPSLVGTGEGRKERALFDQVLRDSHRFYAERVGEHGVSRRTNFVARGFGSGLRRIPPELARLRELERLPFEGPSRPGFSVETFLVEPPLLLTHLVQAVRDHGVRMHHRTFRDRGALGEFGDTVVVNCLGLGAGSLFADRRVTPVRGQLVLLEPQDLPWLLSHAGYLFPRSDAVVLGGSVERGVREARSDPATCARILRVHRDFFGAQGA